MQTKEFKRRLSRRVFKAAMTAFALAGFSHLSLAGDDFEKAFEQANQQYDQGKFENAEKTYASIVERGHYSAELFYNLGNTEYRLKKFGQSILNYERSLALAPGNPEAKANLNFVREQTGARISGPDWRDRIIADLDGNSYCVAASVAGWIAIFLIVTLLLTVRTDRGWLTITAIFCFSLFCYAIFALYHLEKDRTAAIVTAGKAEARYAPADNSTLAATLPAGSRVLILERRGPWIYCALPDSNRAWISADSLEAVRLQAS